MIVKRTIVDKQRVFVEDTIIEPREGVVVFLALEQTMVEEVGGIHLHSTEVGA